MGIRIRIPESPNGLVHVAPAPMCEAVLSLHVLMHPKEHPLQHPWIREMRSLSPALKREIRAFHFLYSDITADFMLPERADSPQSFDEALAGFAALPAERAQYEIARPTFHYLGEMEGPESLERDDVRARVGSQLGAELAHQLFDDPAAVQARVVDISPRTGRSRSPRSGSGWSRSSPRRSTAPAGATRSSSSAKSAPS